MKGDGWLESEPVQRVCGSQAVPDVMKSRGGRYRRHQQQQQRVRGPELPETFNLAHSTVPVLPESAVEAAASGQWTRGYSQMLGRPTLAVTGSAREAACLC